MADIRNTTAVIPASSREGWHSCFGFFLNLPRSENYIPADLSDSIAREP